MNPTWAALVSICMSVAAQFALKRGMSSAAVHGASTGGVDLRSIASLALNPYILLGLALYALGAVVWLAVLARWDVSKAYPLVGLGFVLTVVAGYLAGEAVSAQRVLGVAAICLGVWMVARS